MKAVAWAVFPVLAAAALAGCGEGPYGERPQVIVYEQGEYQGKPDDLPWANERFNNDRTAWSNAIKTRQQDQNEYRKAGGAYQSP
ncbi:MAG: hypothetical protein M3Z21_04750 [Pseudomonadota bacterium]|nr:hypothetical protein [Pseudomonadota bacterium]